MKIETEIELKTSINKSTYNKLLSKFLKNNKIITQRNYYFDTIDLKYLKQKNTIRIRTIENNYQLTLKIRKDEVILEKSLDIDINTFNQYIEDGIQLSKFDIDDRVYFRASNLTRRFSFKYLSGEIFIDKTTYGNNTDYEIEFESDSIENCENDFFIFLRRNSILYQTIPPKSFRAIIDK